MGKKQCANAQVNGRNCNCTYGGCSRHGVCCECLRYHLDRRELPACAFPDEVEKSWDRSFERFIKTYR